MNYSLHCLGYNWKLMDVFASLVERFSGNGLLACDSHPYGIGCYECVHKFYFSFDTLENLNNARDVAEEVGFKPFVSIDNSAIECDPEFTNPYNIILNQPITKRWKKEILEDIALWEESREFHKKVYEMEQELYKNRKRSVKKYEKKYAN